MEPTPASQPASQPAESGGQSWPDSLSDPTKGHVIAVPLVIVSNTLLAIIIIFLFSSLIKSLTTL
jgi:hypothetical protein